MISESENYCQMFCPAKTPEALPCRMARQLLQQNALGGPGQTPLDEKSMQQYIGNLPMYEDFSACQNPEALQAAITIVLTEREILPSEGVILTKEALERRLPVSLTS